MGRRGMAPSERVRQRLDEELAVIDQLGYPSYFLTVADVVDLIKSLRVRAAARGSGAGSLVTYLLGISDVDPIRYGLLMERFLSPLRHQLPDIDAPSTVNLIVGWELSWYRFRIDLGDAADPVGLAAKGDELDDIDEELRNWNAGLDAEGRLVIGVAQQ